MASFVTGQLLSAAALDAAFAQCFPAGSVSTYSATLLSSTSAAAWYAALGLPTGVPGAANGLATLDSTGRLPASQLTAAVVGAMVYQGTWNASTNTPALASSVGTTGQYYQVSVAGTTALNGVAQWNVGDIAAFNGSVWQKIDGVANEVTSVVGLTGAVTAAQITAAQSAFTGDSGSGGAQGLVPAPATGSAASNEVLGAGGSWVGRMAGFRSRLRNASFAINQRGVSGTVTLTAGQYGHDGVKAGASGATYTFATSGIDTTITITAGSLILPIEAALIEGGNYAVSSSGTAQARVWQGTGSTGSGSYATAPFAAVGLTGNTQTNVEFSTGSVLRPQFEPGTAVTPFDRRPPGVELALCQRYFAKSYPQATAPGTNLGDGNSGVTVSVTSQSSGIAGTTMPFPTTMRSTPTLTVYDALGNSGKVSVLYSGTWTNSVSPVNSYSTSSGYFFVNYSGSVQNMGFDFTAAAEL